MNKLDTAIEFLSATLLDSGDYVYYADEGEGWFVAPVDEMKDLGRALKRGERDAYSLWCGWAGREATFDECAEVDPSLPREPDDLRYHVCPEDRGQIVTVSYGVDSDYVYRRSSCAPKVTVHRAEWRGAEGEFEPWNGIIPDFDLDDWERIVPA